jgi:hypothetical protein
VNVEPYCRCPGCGECSAHREVRKLKEALTGLLARHKDGSDERHWAEWDTAREVLKEVK